MNAPRIGSTTVISSCIQRMALMGIVAFSGCATTNHGRMAKAGPAPPASDEQTADAWVGGMFMAPFIIAVLPVGGLVWGIRSLAPAKVEKFYVPAGYQRHGADQWIASMTNPCGGEPVRTTALKNGDEFLTVKTDRTLIYARFHHGVTVEYSR